MSLYKRARERAQSHDRKGRTSLNIAVVAAMIAVLVPFSAAGATGVDSTEDITPPAIVSVELDQTTVDVTDGVKYITATIHATDDLSGVQSVNVYYRHRTQNNGISIYASLYNRVSGDELDGIYERTVAIPATTAAGDYDLYYVQAYDTVGNYVRDFESDVAPPTITVISPVDVTPPEIESLTVVNPDIDVSTDLANVGLEAIATDDVSGVSYISVGFVSPSGRQYASTSLRPTIDDPTLLRGSALVAGFSEPGEWLLDTVCVADLTRNSECWNRWSDPTAYELFGLSLNVTSNFADSIPPELQQYDIDPLDVDVTLGPEDVTIDFDVTDNAAGVAYAYITFASPRTVGATPEVIYRSSYAHAPRLWDATYDDGVWSYERNSNEPLLDGMVSGIVRFPRYDRSGDWQITQVCVVDNVNWRTCYIGDDLVGLGPETLGVEWNRTPGVAVTGIDAPSYPANDQPDVGCAVEDLEDGTVEGVVPDITGPDANNIVTVTCSYTDTGGITGFASATYEIEIETDSTPPTLSGTPTTDPNVNGWYRGDVTIEWTAADADSGIDNATMPGPSTIVGDGTGLTADASVSDLAGNATDATSAPPVSIDATAPTVGTPVLSVSPKANDETSTLSASVADALSGIDASEYYIDVDPGVGNGTTMTVADDTASADIGADLEPGVYTVYVRTVDLAGNWSAASSTMLVVYDPSGGFVTGGGWIDSVAGSYVDDPLAAGPARFGFVAKYKKGANTPDGNTEFHFHAGDLRFSSTSYDWLVVSGGTARFKGDGQLDGVGGYSFKLSACDVGVNGSCSGSDQDALRMVIWETATDRAVYDSAAMNGDDDGGSTPLSSGSVHVHKAKGKGK